VVACTPHTGLGTIAVQRAAYVQVVNLATCEQSKAPTPGTTSPVTVRVTPTSQSIVYQGRVVLTIKESHKVAPAGMPGPIEPFGVSPDRRWILYAIDPQGSASLAADGLALRAVRVTGGRSFPVAFGLAYDDYHAWCGGRLVMTSGGDRIAIHAKRLIVTGPPDWRARPLVRAPGRAFGSVACAPDGKSVVVQSQRSGTDAYFFHTRWALWRVGLDGAMTQLTAPPAKHADESPRFSRDGKTVYFVRSQHGRGQLYALKGGRVIGPLLSLGYSLGYYGHENWPYSVRR
jgi:WD40-like Beta Propeller Repeat